MRFHPEIPLIALFGRMHFRGALLFLVLGGGRRGDQRGVHQRAFAQRQAARGEVGIDGGKESFAQVVGFEQAAEFQQRGGIGHARGGQINPRKPSQCLPVVARVFEGFVGQARPLLNKIDRSIRSRPTGGRPRSPVG